MSNESEVDANEIAALVELVRSKVERCGVLLVTDRVLPSLTTLVAGEPVRGSWWGHERGHEMYEVLNSLGDDVAFVKLLKKKETIVHRRLWRALVTVGSSRDSWQLRSLRDDAGALLSMVDDGPVRTDRVDVEALPVDARKVGRIATDLEKRLLIVSRQEHTESGHHARYLETWDRFAERHGLDELPAPDTAYRLLREAERSLAPNADTLPFG